VERGGTKGKKSVGSNAEWGRTGVAFAHALVANRCVPKKKKLEINADHFAYKRGENRKNPSKPLSQIKKMRGRVLTKTFIRR